MHGKVLPQVLLLVLIITGHYNVMIVTDIWSIRRGDGDFAVCLFNEHNMIFIYVYI